MNSSIAFRAARVRAMIRRHGASGAVLGIFFGRIAISEPLDLFGFRDRVATLIPSVQVFGLYRGRVSTLDL